ncbi:hypothetical protein SAY87_001104 [Trapa incisa]|uniref:Tify domain-containing protein n=1 Tax=Trapa incisa TaxID=236973 RepID=A0AAN7GN66_9MYRT|nr:hypothetical protein SAY87_001104 [Trapa incisa]
MSFQQKSFWMPRDAGCASNGDINYDNSGKIEPKRSHQWLVDGTATQVFSNKKQAMEAITGQPVPDIALTNIASTNIASWNSNTNFQSMQGQYTDRLFGSEPMRSISVVDRNTTPFNASDVSMGRRYSKDQFANESSVNLSMSQSNEGPSSFINFGGIRKVKINQLSESENMSSSMGSSYRMADNSGISYKTGGNSTFSGLAYHDRGENNVSPVYGKVSENFISTSHNFDKKDGNFISMGHNYNKGGESLLSMAQPFGKGNGGFISMDQAFRKGDVDESLGISYNKEHTNFISTGQSFGKTGQNLTSMPPSFNKGNDSMISMSHTYNRADGNISLMDNTYEKGNAGILSVGQSYKGDISKLSFGGVVDESEGSLSGTIIGNYEIVIDSEGLTQGSEMACHKTMIDSSLDQTMNNSTATKATKVNCRTDKSKESKVAKKAAPNNFPSNVKSLLSTGLLDGVPVKYVSWSREKNLKAIIRGTGYLCGCTECNHSKSLNAYEFERHAGCKTKHPNNHIYFDNGKTIYAVVQELKNTPQEALFDAIQNITGSPINQNNFRTWKASYQAAARELQRIYGKDEVKMPC